MKPAPVRAVVHAAARFLFLLVVLFVAVLSFCSPELQGAGHGSPVTTPEPRIIELQINGPIHPMTVEYVNRGFDEAKTTGAALILIHMDTPGGLDSSMREIIQRIITSPSPVVVYVNPSGRRAASAGFYILQAADVAVMAPGTHTGAASPVLVNPFTGTPVEIPETMRKKVVNDALAYLRNLATKRGRSVTDAELTVTEARSFTADEALKRKMIDLIVDSTGRLLEQLEGREVTRFDGTKTKLAVAQATRVRVEMTARQRFLARILEPDVFFLLLILGVLGLYTEFTHPGLIVPGVIGGISAVLALYAMNILPVNAAGVMLILLGIALFILEAKFTSHGVLGVGGAVAMLLGALMLVRPGITGFRVNLGMALAVTLPTALITIFLATLVFRSRQLKVAIGAEQMVGAMGKVRETIAPGQEGMVFLQSELWRAVAPVEIPVGAEVRVLKVDGLVLHVEPLEKAAPDES
jgi:membrane-bound serine protease (ClpP class)